jgi:hypothetical protein
MSGRRLLFGLLGEREFEGRLHFAEQELRSPFDFVRPVTEVDQVAIGGYEGASFLQRGVQVAGAALDGAHRVDDLEHLIDRLRVLFLAVELLDQLAEFVQMLREAGGAGAEVARQPVSFRAPPEEASLPLVVARVRWFMQDKEQMAIGGHGSLAADFVAQSFANGGRDDPGRRKDIFRWGHTVFSRAWDTTSTLLARRVSEGGAGTRSAVSMHFL